MIAQNFTVPFGASVRLVCLDKGREERASDQVAKNAISPYHPVLTDLTLRKLPARTRTFCKDSAAARWANGFPCEYMLINGTLRYILIVEFPFASYVFTCQHA